MQNKERIIKTNTNGKKANEILSAVIGQMSDGMFENSRYYEGYWMFCDIDDGNNICVDDREREFVEFYFNMKMESLLNENSND